MITRESDVTPQDIANVRTAFNFWDARIGLTDLECMGAAMVFARSRIAAEKAVLNRLRNLPDDLIEDVFNRLPANKAYGTLATRWIATALAAILERQA